MHDLGYVCTHYLISANIFANRVLSTDCQVYEDVKDSLQVHERILTLFRLW